MAEQEASCSSEKKPSYLFAYADEEEPPAQEPKAVEGNEADKRRLLKAPKLPPAFASQGHVKLLNTAQLVALTFFCVTGGPFGFEETVQTGGPVLMLAGLFVYSILWSTPLALMTTELSCMIPESGGHVLWVYRALGPFWSFVNSYFAFACSVLDNALYPVLFVEYLAALLYDESISFAWGVLLKILVVVLASMLNIWGIGIVGNAAVVLAFLVLAPFAAMIFMGLPYLNFVWAEGPLPKSIDWGRFLIVLLWNTSGFDAVGTCASEVKNPAHSYPRALGTSVVLITIVFSLPTVIGVSVIPNYLEWKNGTYMRVAKLIGGNGLKVPSTFSKLHSVYRTPYNAILLTSGCTMLLIGFSAYSLAEADMLFYALSTIIKFSALIQLRFTEPDAFRPFKIPFEDQVLAGLTGIPIFICIIMIYLASDHAQVIGLLGSVIGIFGYIAKELLTQFGTEAEEVMQQRMAKVQQNIERMQQRVDNVIATEFRAPLNQLGALPTAFMRGASPARAPSPPQQLSIQETRPSKHRLATMTK